MAYKKQPGIISAIIILIVLVSSAALVFGLMKATKKDQTASAHHNNTPIGDLKLSSEVIANTGSVTLTAHHVAGANGAQVDNVRYYLYNPSLATGHDWGDPSWCANGSPCTKDNHPGVFTYDISESSNPANNYEIVWDANTHSSGSTPYSRALKPSNIPPGYYKVGIRVEDVNGNVNGGASQASLNITADLGISGVPNSLNVRVPRFGSNKAFNFTNSSGKVITFQFYGYPTTFGPGLNWHFASGGMQVGQTLTQKVNATGTVPPLSGTYNGQGRIENYTDRVSVTFPVTVEVYCPDMNSDGRINVADSGLLARTIGTTGDNLKEDLNADGVVNVADQGILAKSFGVCK